MSDCNTTSSLNFNSFDFSLARSCIYLWLSVYAVILLAIELTNIYVIVILIVGPIGTYWLIANYSIAPPNESIAYEIFGCELKDEEIIYAKTNRNLVTYCDKPEDFLMKVIAHRFGAIEAPENSLEALETCFKNGAVAVEFDLTMTADMVPIIFHDDTLDRVTEAVGNVCDKTWDEIKQLDISAKHPFHQKFKGSRIPLFEDVIKRCLEYDMRFFIDVKDYRVEVVNTILEMYEKYPKMYKRGIVSSFSAMFLYNVRRANPSIVTSMAWRPCYVSCAKYSLNDDECIPYSKFPPTHYYYRFMDIITTWIFHNLAAQLIGFSAVLLLKDVITLDTVVFWKSKNIRLFAWTVNNHYEKLHCSRTLGIGYITDSMLNGQ